MSPQSRNQVWPGESHQALVSLTAPIHADILLYESWPMIPGQGQNSPSSALLGLGDV